MPGDWETSALYQPTKAGVFHLSGDRDEYYPTSRLSGYAQQLRMRAGDVEFKGYDAGHEIVQPMREDIRAWLQNRSQ